MSQKQLAFYAKFLTLVLAFTFADAMVRYPSTSEKPVFAQAMPVVAPVHTYTTDFPLRENPLSEGGRWIDGKTVGLDWGNISTTPGLAIGHAGPKPFADATALLTGAWGPTQAAEVVVYSKAPYRYPEVSLRLRSSLSPHKCTGYEISNSLRKGKSAYLIIVRWNGPLADFTYLAQLGGKKYAVATGDVVKATIIGNVITAYKNGVQLAQVKDDTFATGNPGMGFNEGINGDYGVSRFSATDAPIDADTATVRGSEK
ncbi:MAG TPA: hypothetical protein VE195_08960 [Acidobacteriaceae bacterium]|nr:hypothetical protein [Acidobacteriaceae bacterium]